MSPLYKPSVQTLFFPNRPHHISVESLRVIEFVFLVWQVGQHLTDGKKGSKKSRGARGPSVNRPKLLLIVKISFYDVATKRRKNLAKIF